MCSSDLARIQFRDMILGLKEQGKTIFFSSHELSEAELICDRVAILKAGSLVWCGTTRDAAGDGQQNLERIFLRMLGEATCQPLAEAPEKLEGLL